MYYNEALKPRMLENSVEFLNIDLKDEFTKADINSKSCRYKTEQEYIRDLSRVMRYITNIRKVYIVKQFDNRTNRFNFVFKPEAGMREDLSFSLSQFGDEHGTGWSVFRHYDSLIEMKKGMKFFSTDKEVFSVWQGWKYNKLEVVDEGVVKDWLCMVKDVMASGNELLYNYVLDWVAFILQNVGKKTGTNIILQGLQGVGKGRFCDVVAELFAGYSNPNINKIDEITGQFNAVLEGKVLIVLNEARSVDEEKNTNYDVLKSITTDETFTINEKNVPRFYAENVVNLIISTNNVYPVKIEASDRRYVVLRCCGVHINDFDYWKRLSDGFTVDFYNNLYTFLLSRDISQFNPRVIPMTEEKLDLIRVGRTEIDIIIIEHLEEFKKGIDCCDAERYKPGGMKLPNFRLYVKSKCVVKQRGSGTRKRYYLLREEMYAVYEKMMGDDYIAEDIDL
jgi:hypothetical protein